MLTPCLKMYQSLKAVFFIILNTHDYVYDQEGKKHIDWERNENLKLM